MSSSSLENAVYTVSPPPAKPTSPFPAGSLTAEQTKMYDEVLSHFASKPEDALTEREKFWLSHECLLRYLRATKWKVDQAIQRLEATLKWRKEFGIDMDEGKVTPEHVEPEATTGKAVAFGYDVHGRPAYYMIPARQNTEDSPRQVEHTFFMLERIIDLMPVGVETLVLLINFADRGRSPSMNTSRTVLNILQEHYPERLGLAVLINIPYLVNMFLKLIMPFVDPVTKSKVSLNEDPVKKEVFTADNMINSIGWGGSANFVYEHDKYWPSFIETCKERRKHNLERWRSLGGTLGIKESEYKTEGDQVQDVPVVVLPETGTETGEGAVSAGSTTVA